MTPKAKYVSFVCSDPKGRRVGLIYSWVSSTHHDLADSAAERFWRNSYLPNQFFLRVPHFCTRHLDVVLAYYFLPLLKLSFNIDKEKEHLVSPVKLNYACFFVHMNLLLRESLEP